MIRGGTKSRNARVSICLLLFLAILPAAAFGGNFPSPAVFTNKFAFYYVLSFKIDGVAAKTGDEVAFFDPQGVLCGSYIVGNSPSFTVPVYGDDTTTPAVDEGATEGDVLTVKVWQVSTGLEFSGSQLILSPGNLPGSVSPSAIPPVWQDQAAYALNIETTTHFLPPVATARPPANYIGSLSIKGKPAEIGDEVAAFDGKGVVRGLVRVNKPGYYGNMAVYGDEGTVAGAELTFKVWDHKAGVEYSGTALTLRPGAATGSYLSSLIPPVWQENAGYVLNIDVLAISLGDVDGNGRVDLADAILALQVCAGFATPDARLSSDVSGDTKIGLQEVIYILQKTAQLR